MALFLQKKDYDNLYEEDYVSIFSMKFNLRSYFTRCILNEILELVNQNSCRSSSAIDGVSQETINDFYHLRSSLAYIRDNIDVINNLEVEGSSFRLISRVCDEKDNYQVEIQMKANKNTEFYNKILLFNAEDSAQNFLESIDFTS